MRTARAITLRSLACIGAGRHGGVRGGYTIFGSTDPGRFTPEVVEKQLSTAIGNPHYARWLTGMAEAISAGQLDTWDIQWTMGQLLRGDLAITSSTNLCANIGHAQQATHTTRYSMLSNLPCSPVEFPLKHPQSMDADDAYDRLAMGWYAGHPDVAAILLSAQERFRAGHYLRTILVLDAGLNADVPATDSQIAALHDLRARALSAMGRCSGGRTANH